MSKEGVSRRCFLGLCAAGVAGVGSVVSAVPFVRALAPARDTLKKGESILIPTGQLPEEGDAIYTSWRAQQVIIIHLKEEWSKQLEKTPIDSLKDPSSFKDRVKDPKWFVALSVCTHAYCSPAYMNPEDVGHKGKKEIEEVRHISGKVKVGDIVPEGMPLLRCPCHFGVYDLAGRVLAPPPPENLWLAPYEFTDQGLVIGNIEFSGFMAGIKDINKLPKVSALPEGFEAGEEEEETEEEV